MSNVTNSTLSNFYSLKDAKNAATNTTLQQSSSPSLTSALAVVNGGKTDSSKLAVGSSYLLDLSDNARNYLQSLSDTNSGKGSSTRSSGGIVLTNKEQAKLTEILIRYKDAPYNDTTFKKIQEDLDAADIGADALAAKAQARQLNPTLIFLDALNGGDGAAGTTGNSESRTADATGYLQKVARQWETISTTAGTPVKDTDEA